MMTTGHTSDPALTLARQVLTTAIIGDILDRYRRPQQFLSPQLTPLIPSARIAGRAMPVVMSDIDTAPQKPFGLLTEALDQLQPDEVYLSSATAQPLAHWGEIMTATAQQRHCVGAIVDGYYRDTSQVLAREFPVWGVGAYGASAGSRAIVTDFRVPITCGGVTVTPGDLVVADRDGVVVVPRDIEDDVMAEAAGIAAKENVVCREIDGGLSATAAFSTHGIL